MKVLVIDDHALIRDALRRVLKELRRDTAVLEASSAAEALETIADNPEIGLILLSIFTRLIAMDFHTARGTARTEAGGSRRCAFRFPGPHQCRARARSRCARVYSKIRQARSHAGRARAGSFRRYLCPAGDSSSRANVGRSAQACARRASTPITRGFGPDDAADRSPVADDEGQEQQGDLPHARPLRADRENHVTAILRALKVTNRTEAVIAANDMGWEFPAARIRARAPEV